MRQALALFLVKRCKGSLLQEDAFSAIGYFDMEAPTDGAIVLLYKFVYRHEVVAVFCAVILLAFAVDIGHKQAVTMEFAGGITKNADADVPCLPGCVIILAGDQGRMRVVYVLCEGLVNGKADKGITCGESER